jgi:hypothetical protein
VGGERPFENTGRVGSAGLFRPGVAAGLAEATGIGGVRRLTAAALLVALAQAGMIALSPVLSDDAGAPALPVLGFVGLGLLGGAAWFAAAGPLGRLPPRPAAVLAVVAFGLGMRLAWFGTPVVLDTDALRYLWDGGLAANGIWPWAAPPAGGVPPRLGEPAAALGARMPFAELRTIYPATAQAAFLLAHWIAPWEVAGLRLVLLGAEILGLLLLAALLSRAGLPVMRAAVWWCCPLLPVVLTNAAHVDALLPPLLAGALLATLSGRGALAGGLLGLAAGVKLWPVLLAPLLARWLPRGARPGAAAGFGLAGAITVGPLLATMTAPDAGLNAYAGGWAANNAPLAWAQAGFGPEADGIIRPLLAAAGAAVALGVAFRQPAEPAALVGGALLVAAATFYLSPAQFPWYAVWFLPFAAALGCRALLLPAVLLPLYYAFFALRGPGLGAAFAHGVAAIHLAGVLAMLAVPGGRVAARR